MQNQFFSQLFPTLACTHIIIIPHKKYYNYNAMTFFHTQDLRKWHKVNGVPVYIPPNLSSPSWCELVSCLKAYKVMKVMHSGDIYYYSYAQKLLPLSSKRNLSPDIENVMGVVCLETGSVLWILRWIQGSPISWSTFTSWSKTTGTYK